MITEARYTQLVDNLSNAGSVLVLGDVGVDKYTQGDVNRISPEAPVPIVEVSRQWFKLGLAANVSDNLHGLDASSTLIGVVGEDEHADTLEGLLEDHEIVTWGIVRASGRLTTFKERIVTTGQQVCRVDYETAGGIDQATQSRVLQRVSDFFPEHNAIIIEDYGKGLCTEELVQSVIKDAKAKGKRVLVDPSRTTPPLWYRGASVLKPNRQEALLMASALGLRTQDIQEVASLLLKELELESVVITLGPDGLVYQSKGDKEMTSIPTVASEVFDVSGAGDTVIATLTSALVSGASLEEACWLGNCAASVVVQKKGTARITSSELRGAYARISSCFS